MIDWRRLQMDGEPPRWFLVLVGLMWLAVLVALIILAVSLVATL